MSSFLLSPTLLKSLPNQQTIIDMYLEEAYEQASSNTFHISNKFSKELPNVEDIFSEFITEEQAFLLIAHIIKASYNNSFDSEALKNSNFASIPNLKALAKIYLENNMDEALEKFTDMHIGDGDDFKTDIENRLLND